MNSILVNIKSHSPSTDDAGFKHQSKQSEDIFLWFSQIPAIISKGAYAKHDLINKSFVREKNHIQGKVITWKSLISANTSWKRQSSNCSWASIKSYTEYYVWNNFLKQRKSLKQKKYSVS